jgi:integrase/recombinase XerC
MMVLPVPTTAQMAARLCSILRQRGLLDSINTSTHAGLHDRALIGLMVYSFARIGPALGMTVEDVFTQNRRLWVRLREKGGKRHTMPCHHNLEEYVTGYLDGAGLRGDPKGPLFRTIGRGTGQLTRTVLPQANAYAMIGRRAAGAGIATKLGNRTYQATGSQPVSRTAARLKSRRRWRTTLPPAQRSFTIVGATS